MISGQKILMLMGFYFRSILVRIGVLSGDFVIFVSHLMSLDPFPPLNTDCPEVVGLVNHSATVLVMAKMFILY